ncbi:MAG: ABC transporter substrate-binding protein [Vicingaceae bacterium]
MKKIFLSSLIISVFLFSACNTDNKKKHIQKEKESISNCLDFAIHEKYTTLDPIKIKDETSFYILSQIYEPLLRFNESDLTLEPLLAESWSISEDNLVYTFKLKKNVFFHNNKTKAFNANDVVYTFERIFSNIEGNYAYSLFRNTVKGGEQHKNTGEKISGINVIDDYTISFTLSKPSSHFLNLLAIECAAIVNKSAIEKNIVAGTGPFVYDKKNDTDLLIKLNKNTNYHITSKKGSPLPYIDAVAFNYIKDGQDELSLFKAGKLDVIDGIPPESVKEIVETEISNFQNKPNKYILGRYPKISTSYLSINTAIEPFNNTNVRRAINMAIDKEKIVTQVLKGEAYSPGNNGLVPPAIKGYDYSSVIGEEHNVSKAKKLLAKAGYPNGKDFPIIKFSTGKGNSSVRVALEIQKQLLSNLNINVEISSLTQQELYELNSSSNTNISLSGWLGEFPDPISFLSLCYGKDLPETITESAYPNESRFNNKKFNQLYEKATTTLDLKKRYELCLDADQIIANEVPVIPLWYHENYQLIHSSIKNYKANPMNIQYLTHVKIEVPTPVKKEE